MGRLKKIKGRQSIGRRICKAFKRIDLYGKDISLSYEGEEKFKTYIGAITSFVIGTTMVVYFVYLFLVLVSKSNSSVSKTTLRKELSLDSEVQYLGVNNFMFGITVDYNGYNLLKDPTYLSYIIENVRQEYSNNTGNDQTFIREYITVNTKLCGNSFVGMNQTLVEAVGIDQYFCPSDKNFTIAASFYASRYDYIQIKVYKCANSTKSSVICKSTQEIENAVKVSTLRVPITNTYFDFNDYQSPITYFIDDEFYWDLIPGYRKKSDILVQK